MNFCSKCGSARIEKKIPEGDTLPRYICQDCGEIHYSNPNVVTGVLPINDANEILLCRRSTVSYTHLTLPTTTLV